jgi:predicted PilT family ATPase
VNKIHVLGLHAGGSLEENIIAGPWHPAFRELCESTLYLKRARAVLQGCRADRVTLNVCGRDASKLIGQHRENIIKLENEFKIKINIKQADMPCNEVRLSAE